MRRRVLSLLLVFVMALGMLPATALAAETAELTVTAGEAVSPASYVGTGGEESLGQEGDVYALQLSGVMDISVSGSAADGGVTAANVSGGVLAEFPAWPVELSAEDLENYVLSEEELADCTDCGIDFAGASWACIILSDEAGSRDYLFLMLGEQAVSAVDATEVTVTDNVIDITDYTVASWNRYTNVVTNIAVSGADVVSAEEDGTTVNVFLDGTTAADAALTVTFGTSVGRGSMTQDVSECTLEKGEAAMTVTVNSSYAGSIMKGSVTYTINFSLDAPPTEVPTRLVESDAKEAYNSVALALNLKDYFSGASAYYLVEGETLTELDGSSYSFVTTEGGEHTLVFAASNVVGSCPDYVTVTVTVTEIQSGIWIGHETTNGSIDYVLFTDANGDPIDDLTVTYANGTFDVVLPQGFDLAATVTAAFNRTANDSDIPFLTPSNAFNRAYSSRTDTYTTTLSSGAGTAAMYLYNLNPGATTNHYATWRINYKVFNNMPTLAEGAASTDAQTITAMEDSYSVDLSQLFSDADGQELSYQVSINSDDYADCDANYTYSTNIAGTDVLRFRATDGQDYSEDLYTVTLTVQNSTATYAVPVTVSDSVEGLTFYAASLTGDVLTYEEGSVQVPQNVTTLWWNTTDGMSSSVAVADGTSLNLQLTTMVVKNAAGETDTAATVIVTNPNGDTAVASGYTYLLASGDGYTYAVTPGSSSWNAVTLTEQTVTPDASAEVVVELTLKNAKSVTVPSGAEVHVYSQSGYTDGCSNDTELASVYSVTNEDGTVTYYYSFGSSGYGSGYSYVAFYKDYISYAGYFNDVTDAVLSWDGETKTPSYRGAYDTSTTFGSRGDDSILTNVNSNGHLVLSTGSEFMLKNYRSWQIINNDTTNIIIEPEYNYTTSNENITITPYNDRNSGVSGTSSNNWAYITANTAGTTYLEIGYDAVHIVHGYATNDSGGASGQPSNFTWNASDPNRTALIVVQTDGNAASGVSFGIQSPSGSWDYEYDTVYFTEDQGSLTMIPTATDGIGSVAVSHDKGNSYTDLTGTDGTYTVPIVAGNNIIRITDSNGKTAYQVVRGAKVSYTVENVTEGKATTDEIVSGDTVRITFSTMHAVCAKISGIYNPGYPSSNKLNYMCNDVAVVQSTGYQYDFHNNVWIEVTAGNEDLVLTGGYMNSPAAFGSAIGALYDAAAVNSSGSGTTSRNILPDITIPVSGIVNIPATAVTLSSETLSLGIGGTAVLKATVTPGDTTDTVVWSSSDEAVATVDKNGVVTAVAAGSATITATAGDASASCAVTVTAEQAGLIEIETLYANPEEVFAATLGLSSIKISGAEPVGEVSGSDPDWTVNVAEDSGDSLTISMQAVMGTMMEGNVANWYFWVNGVLSENAMGSYDNYAYSTTITPEWKDGTTVITLGVGTASAIRTSYTVTLTRVAGSTEYTVTLTEGEGYTIEASEGSESPVAEGGSYSFTVTVADGYDGTNMVVKANEETLTAADGVYTIENITADQTVTVEGVVLAYGDLNGDGTVNAADAATAYAIANGKLPADAEQTKAADVNGDGIVNAADAALIYAYANGKITGFPAAE